MAQCRVAIRGGWGRCPGYSQGRTYCITRPRLDGSRSAPTCRAARWLSLGAVPVQAQPWRCAGAGYR
jgi:hypothetical protein